METNVSLVTELCRVLDSSERAMLCAMSHGRVTIDGYIVRPHHDRQWTKRQLAGRHAQCFARAAALFGAGRRMA